LIRSIIEEIIVIVGAENVQCDDYNRVKYSYGKLAEEMVALKRGSPARDHRRGGSSA
jgi:hypothetical protein